MRNLLMIAMVSAAALLSGCMVGVDEGVEDEVSADENVGEAAQEANSSALLTSNGGDEGQTSDALPSGDYCFAKCSNGRVYVGPNVTKYCNNWGQTVCGNRGTYLVDAYWCSPYICAADVILW